MNQYELLKDIEWKLSLDWESLFKHYVKEHFVVKWSTLYIPCPFHWESTPSFWVSFSKKVMKCFWCSKWYGSILFFLKDYLAISTQNLIERLQKDWFIKDLNILGENFLSYIELDIKKKIYKSFELPLKEQHPLMQRMLFSVGWIGKITQEKLDEVKEMVKQKFSSDEKKMNIANKIITILEKKSLDSYILISDDYNKSLLYSWTRWSKTINPEFETLDFDYIMNNNEINQINELIKDNILFQSFWKQMKIDEALNIWLDNKRKVFFSSKGYTSFLKENLDIDPDNYKENLPNYFIHQEQNVQFFIGEWFFDVYSLGLLWVPYITHWTWAENKKVYTFIKHLAKKVRTINKDSCLNLCFDNDNSWIKATTRFLNQYMKLVRQWNIKTNNLDVRIFNFKYFETQVNRILSILVSLIRKWEATLIQYYNDLKEKMRYLTPALHYDICENTFFWYFLDVETDYSMITKFKKKYEYNYSDKNEKDNIKAMKDLWELPSIIFGMQASLDKVFNKNYESLSKEDFVEFKKVFNTLITWCFNSIFHKSFVDIDTFKEILNKKISSKEIKRDEIDEILHEDYLFGTFKTTKSVQLDKAIQKNLELFAKEIDIELEALTSINFLCYNSEMKEQQLLSDNDLRNIRKICKEELHNNIPIILSERYTKLANIRTKVDAYDEKISSWEGTKEDELMFDTLYEIYEKEVQKVLLYLNLWDELCNEKWTTLGESVFKYKWYAEDEAKMIWERNKKYITTPEAIQFVYTLNAFEKTQELLWQYIKNKIIEHGSQDNIFSFSFLKRCLYNIIRLKKQS